MASAIPLTDLLSVLSVGGVVVSVGLPNEPLPTIMAQDFAANQSSFQVTHMCVFSLPSLAFTDSLYSGSKKECMAMLKLAVDKNVRTWVQLMDMKDASKAVRALKSGAGSKGDHDVRYRQVLRQDLVQY